MCDGVVVTQQGIIISSRSIWNRLMADNSSLKILNLFRNFRTKLFHLRSGRSQMELTARDRLAVWNWGCDIPNIFYGFECVNLLSQWMIRVEVDISSRICWFNIPIYNDSLVIDSNHKVEISRSTTSWIEQWKPLKMPRVDTTIEPGMVAIRSSTYLKRTVDERKFFTQWSNNWSITIQAKIRLIWLFICVPNCL